MCLLLFSLIAKLYLIYFNTCAFGCKRTEFLFGEKWRHNHHHIIVLMMIIIVIIVIIVIINH